MWIAPTGELDAAKARGTAGERDARYPQASSVSLGAVRLLTADRERAVETPLEPPTVPGPIKENA